jgi:hypothetical protein
MRELKCGKLIQHPRPREFNSEDEDEEENEQENYGCAGTNG